MALSRRIKIIIVAAGAAGSAGAAGLATGAAAPATDPDAGTTRLQIVSGQGGAAVSGAGTQAGTGTPGGKDCPDKTANPAPAEAADSR